MREGDTPIERYPDLAGLFAELDGLYRELTRAAIESLSGDAAALYVPDFFIVGAVKRTVDLVDGVGALARRWNFFAAAPLVRMHLDTLARLAYVVEEPDGHDVAAKAFRGTPFRKLKNSSGETLTDRFLIDRLAKKHAWASTVYDATNRLVHLSADHMIAPFREAHREHGPTNGDLLVRFLIGQGMPNLREGEIRELLSGTIEIARQVLAYVDKWRAWKVRNVVAGAE